jgi:hypothetical protein
MTKRVVTTLAVLAMMLLLVAGCSKPPEAEMQAAQVAIDAARTAEAEQYSPASWRTAQDTLNAANAAKQEQDSKFALFRSYGASKDMFVRAQALAEKASADAAAEKERMRVEVEGMLGQAQAALDAANQALAKAPVGKGNKADIELIKNDLNGVGLAFEDAKADFAAGKYISAKSKVEGVMSNVERITNEIATAAAKKAGR